jgi:transketolase
MAYAARKIEQTNVNVFTLIGDGESAEGSVWEAVNFAGRYELGNLTCIVDCNRLGQSDPTLLEHNVSAYKARFESFGW